jgi:HEAT repeat protein
MSRSPYEEWLDKRQEALSNDPRSIEELIPLALKELEDEDSDKPLFALAVLEARGNKQMFEVARKLCESKDAKERSLGATILSQHVVPRKNLPEEKFGILFTLLEHETDMDVLYSVIYALGHIRDPRAIERIIKFKNHPDKDIRFAVSHGLWTYKDKHAINALIELSSDEADKVRDWATFGLGQMIETNTVRVREALAARLSDTFEEARFEAIKGLALRKDKRALEPLKAELEAGWDADSALEAAAALADPSLLPALLDLRQEGDIDEALEEAIAVCGGEPYRTIE